MTKFLFTVLIGVTCSGCATPSLRSTTVAEQHRTYATEQDLLTTNRITVVIESSDAANSTSENGEWLSGYVLSSESSAIEFGGRYIRVRVWDRCFQSWPGSQPQIIQVIDKDDVVLGAERVGGSPMMIDAWVASHENRLFVYVKCEHRHRGVPGVYIYEIDDKYTIREKAIFFAKKDLDAEREVIRRSLKDVTEKRDFGQETECDQKPVWLYLDFSVAYMGWRQVTDPDYPERGFREHGFKVMDAKETIRVGWPKGPGDISPVGFEVGGKKYTLGMVRSTAEDMKRTKDHRFIIWRDESLKQKASHETQRP